MADLKLKTVRGKNFLSIGNSFLEVRLDTSERTLIKGANGCGKSSVAEMIFYALFGKPYRDIKLGQLINSVNNKNMVVEIEFETLGVNYKVIRGQKPNIFEIYKEGNLIEEDASTRDYQKVLEQQILRTNAATARQLIVIGSATYTPFMQLKAAERRKIIEDVLDISIFSKMSDIAKLKEKEIKSDIAKSNSAIVVRKETIVANQETIDGLISKSEQMSKTKQVALENIRESLANKQQELTNNLAEMEKIKGVSAKYDSLVAADRKLDSKIYSLTSEINERNKTIEKIKTNINCPSCKQTIPESMREEAINDLSENLPTYQAELDKVNDLKSQMTTKIQELSADVAKLNELMAESRLLSSSILHLNERLADYSKDDDTSTLIQSLQANVSDSQAILGELMEALSKQQDELQYYSLVVSMLKDNGVKSTIIDRYLPIINKVTNEYLAEFGMFVGFELSSTFEETIKSRHRDTYSYNSFSEGEKAKIDAALLLCWRHIAQLKSSISCNVLFLDEVGGGSLDSESHEQMVNMIGKSAENVFLITHRDVEEEMFDRVLEFTKPKNYTILDERVL